MLKESFVFMFISSFMALFPVANPVGTGFIINGFLSGLDRSERRSIVRRIAVNYLLIGIGSLAIGHFVLSLFGLSLPIVQLGGGLLICKTALQWLGDSDASTGSAPDKPVDPISVRNLESRVFYPITFPISIGPGSISVIFTLMVIALVIFLMCLILYVILSQGQKITKKVGVTGTMIINKMVAFFTFCVGIQIIAEGVEKIFHLSLS